MYASLNTSRYIYIYIYILLFSCVLKTIRETITTAYDVVYVVTWTLMVLLLGCGTTNLKKDRFSRFKRIIMKINTENRIIRFIVLFDWGSVDFEMVMA